jgi:hypothetical protein
MTPNRTKIGTRPYLDMVFEQEYAPDFLIGAATENRKKYGDPQQ